MPPMEPIPETLEALDEMEPDPAENELLAQLVRLADEAQRLVPDLVGVSVARLDQGVTFTLVASSREVAVLDAVQYLAGGPCVAGAREEAAREFHPDDVLDEGRWQAFAEATAAHAVRSTLTLPVVEGPGVAGSVNLYAASAGAFSDLHEDLADLFGAWAGGAVSNADLSFLTRRDAEASPGRLRGRALLDVAAGMVAEQLGIDTDLAERELREAARRAAVDPVELARQVIDLRWGHRGGPLLP